MWRRHINLQRHWNLENLWWGCLQCMWKSWYFYISTDVFQEACIQKYFCLVCNPTNVNHLETNQTCIQKEVQNLVRACEEFPSVHPCSRFNNVFCEECNIDNVTECSTIVYREKKEVPIDITISNDEFVWSFRFTFGLSSYSDSSDFPVEKNHLVCLPNQMYDKYHVSLYSCFFNR